MKILSNILRNLGAIVYCTLYSYLLWLFFYWITPHIVGLSLWWLLAFPLFLYIIVGTYHIVSMIISLPFIWLIQNKFTKVASVIIFFLTFAPATCLPWILNIDYGISEIIWGIILSAEICRQAFISVITISGVEISTVKSNKISETTKNDETKTSEIILGKPKVVIENEASNFVDEFDKEEFDSYDDEEGPVKVAELLLKHYSKEQAIDIVTDGLERDLNEYKQNQMSEKARSFIDKACRILDVLQPLNMPTWYSHCKSQEELAEFLTIDYNRINDTIDILKKLSQQTNLRAQGMMVVATGPAMTIQANKLLEQSKLYDSMPLFFLEWKRQLGIAALEKKIWRDLIPCNPNSSKSYLIDDYVLGWIFNGKVYVNKEFPINADKAYLHLYTYLWMEHCLMTNHMLFQIMINLASSTEYYHHIRCSKRFLDLNKNEAAIKALCYLVAFDGMDIFLDDKRKKQLMSSELAEYKTFDLPRMIDLTIEEAKRLPLISFIRGDKISDKDICGEIKFYNSKQ